MDEAKEFLSGILKTVRDRLGNPLLSAFAIAWVIWNYRFLLVIFGGGGYEAKLKYLDTKLGVGTWQWGVVNGVAMPLVVALVWIFLMPAILRRIAIHHAEQANITKREELTVLGRSPISHEDRVAIQDEMFNRGQAWEKEKSQLREIVTALQKEVENLRNPTEPLQGVPSAPPSPVAAPARNGGEVRLPDFSVDQGKAPPDLDPFSIASEVDATTLTAEQLARRLNIRRSDATLPSLSNSYGVSFLDRSILWPWRVGDMSGSGLPPRVAKQIMSIDLDEIALLLLNLMRSGGEASIPESGKIMGRFESWEATAALHLLATADLAQIRPSGRYQITSSGRLFLLWLQRIGIAFHEPERKQK